MFSNNNRISTRQVFRLFVFDFIGMSTLVLPAKLAQKAGCDGVFAILTGGVLSSFYLWYLARIMRAMDSDLISFVRERLPRWCAVVVLVIFMGYSILEAGYGAYVFADVMKKGLVGQESYTLLLILILLVAAYAIQSGIESRARVYEILFWILFVPLVLLLGIAATDMTRENLTPFFVTPVNDVVWSGTRVFHYLTPVFLVLFFPAYVRKDAQKKMVGAVYAALWVALVVFVVFYLILLGSFGDKAMAQMRYPALTLMSNIHLRGSFLKRLDVFLLAIWFFTLFALINVFLFYARQLLDAVIGMFARNKAHVVKEASGKNECKLTKSRVGEENKAEKASVNEDETKKTVARRGTMWSTMIVTVIVFVVAECFCYGSWMEWFQSYMAYVAVPLLIVLPFGIVVAGKTFGSGR